MQDMLAYTIRSSMYTNNYPTLFVGQGKSKIVMHPQNSQDDSYWIVIIDGMDPTKKVKEFVVPGQNNSSVPAGLDTYMNNPQYIFAVVTQTLSTLHVPQGDFYDFLVKYGADRQLQQLEQINSVLGCGSYGHMSYILTGHCGPRGASDPAPPSYEVGSTTQYAALLLMSLMPLPDGKPPYSICDSNTFITR